MLSEEYIHNRLKKPLLNTSEINMLYEEAIKNKYKNIIKVIKQRLNYFK